MTTSTVVSIRGHARTWNWIKHRILPVLDLVAGPDAHWIWAGPKTHTVTDEGLRADFGTRSHEIIWVEPPPDSNSYTGPAYYDYQAWPSIRSRAPQHVILTRPDLVLWLPNDERSPGGARADEPLEAGELRGWMPTWQGDRWATSDFYARMGLEAANLLHHRWLRPLDVLGADASLGQYIVDQGIYSTCRSEPNRGALASYIVRPGDTIPDRPGAQTNQNTLWPTLSPLVRQRLCQRHQIDPRDYGLEAG